MSRLILLTFMLLLLTIFTWKSYLSVGLHGAFAADRSLYNTNLKYGILSKVWQAELT